MTCSTENTFSSPQYCTWTFSQVMSRSARKLRFAKITLWCVCIIAGPTRLWCYTISIECSHKTTSNLFTWVGISIYILRFIRQTSHCCFNVSCSFSDQRYDSIYMILRMNKTNTIWAPIMCNNQCCNNAAEFIADASFNDVKSFKDKEKVCCTSPNQHYALLSETSPTQACIPTSKPILCYLNADSVIVCRDQRVGQPLFFTLNERVIEWSP